jgi:hypothetical protein
MLWFALLHVITRKATFRARWGPRSLVALCCCCLAAGLWGCVAPPREITRDTLPEAVRVAPRATSRGAPQTTTLLLHLDGTDREIEASAPTVRGALEEASVQLGPLDLVVPPLWTPLRPGLAISITRVVEEREERVITATAQTVRDEFLAPEEGRVLVAAREGREEFVYRRSYDGPQLLGRELVRRHIVVPAQGEVRLVGTKGSLASVPLSGTVAYIANGDAWVLRRESGQKRPLTQGQALDGRVFDLSPDGRWLLYTSPATVTAVSPPATPPATVTTVLPTGTPQVLPTATVTAALNALWVVDTVVLNATPRDTGVRGALWAAWSPQGGAFAYSSAEATRGTPGWRARNDLRLATWPALTATLLLSPTTAFPYAWWGEQWAWSPDGRRLAYARADSLGLYELGSAARRPLATFPPFQTQGNWVWLPALAWARGGDRLAATVHQGEESAATFALLLLALDGAPPRELAHGVGAWAMPAWASAGETLALGLPQGVAEYSLHTLALAAAERPSPLFPAEIATSAYPDFAWSPTGRQLIAAHQGDLFLFDLERGNARPLTASGLASHVRWR